MASHESYEPGPAFMPTTIGIGLLVVGALVDFSGGNPQGADVIGIDFLLMGGAVAVASRYNRNHYQNDQSDGQIPE
jgi:hypothetical protein